LIKPAKGILSERNVIIWDIDQANVIYFSGFFGKPMNIKKPKGPFKEPLVLDPIESIYLSEKKKLEVYDGDKKIVPSRLMDFFKKSYESLEEKYAVYSFLRDQGYVVLPGIKFGGDFAVYRKGPGLEHAPYILNVVKEGKILSVAEIVLAGRLARSVKKKYIFALASERPLLIGLEWWKP